MQGAADDFEDWETCLRQVPVSEYGDPDGGFGYRFDQRDGSGPGYRPALAVDPKSRAGKADYKFLDFTGDGDCRSDAPWPGGTADAAAKRSLAARVSLLERRVGQLRRSARGLDRMVERFDEWSACLTSIPVTEYGDWGRRFGYLYGRKGSTTRSYRPALGIDRSDWNDPDYMMLALVGSEQPGGECEEDPREASSHHSAEVARAARDGDTLLERVLDVRDDLASLQEDVEDLEEPVREFVLFDQCMFTIAANQLGARDGDVGYLFGSGGKRRWPALALDLSGSSPSDYQFLAFPGEEPPSIECNEDAGEEVIDD
jgi:hypothetical protein